jgi:predicted transposase YbfD/YdcC
MDMFHDVYVATFDTHFHDIQDPRIDRTKFHALHDILVMTLCAVICGADGPTAIEQYALDKHDWLTTFLKLPNGIPSHDTIGRVLAQIDPQQFQSCFIRWVQDICHLLPGEVIPIDGKTLRRSFDTELDQKPIHIVSAWASSNRLVLGQMKVDEKSNEITAIPELLTALDLTDCIVTIDAMGCQKDIATTIVEKDADYVLALKGNQETLFNDVQQLFDRLLQDIASNDLHYYETFDERHGRSEHRHYWTTSQLDTLRTRQEWPRLQTIGMVESERSQNAETTIERRYYILSLPSDAQTFGNAVRSHWEIENCVHWVLDVTFREDESRIRVGHGPENFATLRHMALNLLREETSFKGSIKTKRLKCGWNNVYLARVLKLVPF